MLINIKGRYIQLIYIYIYILYIYIYIYIYIYYIFYIVYQSDNITIIQYYLFILNKK